ncbi:hypothetical protein [Streptomyces sp. CA-132043]|uniref:hypothetical protein n=1 Tax=Streptomyces sp. CA-132043 TaxID=3240048 RepID=UPI003D8A34E7
MTLWPQVLAELTENPSTTPPYARRASRAAPPSSPSVVHPKASRPPLAALDLLTGLDPLGP